MDNTKVFAPANLIVIFANVMFFMIIQTLFFRYIASKQFNVVIRDKANIMNEYLKYNKEASKEYDVYKNSKEVNEIKKNAKKQFKERDGINIDNTKTWIGIPFSIVLFILVVLVGMIFYNKNNTWDSVDTVLLSLVVLAYATEVVFYIGLVRQYQFYGDQSIYSGLYDTISEKVDKEPISVEGKNAKKLIRDIISSSESTSDAIYKYNLVKDQIPDITEDYIVRLSNLKYNTNIKPM